MTNQIKNSNQTDEEVKQADSEGKKLGILIAALPIPDDSKQAMLELLPEFSLEQLARLSAILEAMYLNGKTAKADSELVDVLKKLSVEYKGKVRAREEKTQQSLEELRNDIDK